MDGESEDNILTDVIGWIVSSLQAYGWYIVLAIVGCYVLRPYARKFKAELSLRQANNPTRRKILDEERRRVRLRQQMDMLKAAENASSSDVKSSDGGSDDVRQDSPCEERREVKQSPVKPKPKPPKKPPKKYSADSSDYNPLLGGRSGASFRPSTTSRYGSRRKGG